VVLGNGEGGGHIGLQKRRHRVRRSAGGRGSGNRILIFGDYSSSYVGKFREQMCFICFWDTRVHVYRCLDIDLLGIMLTG
jgi:hypothetical protein